MSFFFPDKRLIKCFDHLFAQELFILDINSLLDIYIMHIFLLAMNFQGLFNLKMPLLLKDSYAGYRILG